MRKGARPIPASLLGDSCFVTLASSLLLCHFSCCHSFMVTPFFFNSCTTTLALSLLHDSLVFSLLLGPRLGSDTVETINVPWLTFTFTENLEGFTSKQMYYNGFCLAHDPVRCCSQNGHLVLQLCTPQHAAL